MLPIFRKEIASFFSNITGYVAVLVFLVAGWLFLWVVPPNNTITSYGYASMDKFFDLAPWLLMLLIPAVTMSMLADEYRGGTIEWLSTKPLTTLQIILGKYFASIALIVFALIPTFVYVYSISTLAVAHTTLDWGGITGSYIGLFFLAASFAAIGMWCSSLTSNQIVSYLIALLACIMFYTGFEQLSTLPSFSGGIDYYLSMIGLQFHYQSISRGVIDSRDVIYFVSVAVLFIALTRWSMVRRKGIAG